MNRRKFLASLGITTAGIAFTKAVPLDLSWLSPRDIVPHALGVTPEWMAAEALASLSEQLSPMRLLRLNNIDVGNSTRLLRPEWKHWGVNMNLTDEDLQLPLDQLRTRFLEPAMGALAANVKELKPRFCLPLDLPPGVAFTRRAKDEVSGLDLRLVRGFDIGRGAYTHIDEDTGEITEYAETPPRWMTRFDIAVA